MATVSFDKHLIISDSKKIEDINAALNKEAKKIVIKEDKSLNERKELIKKWFCH